MPATDREDLQSFEPLFPLSRDPGHVKWRAALEHIDLDSAATIREACTSGADTRKVQVLQTACEHLGRQMISTNATIIGEQIVLLAEIGGVHVGFCIAQPKPSSTDLLVIQVVGVVPAAQQNGIGFALFAVAAERGPGRDVAFATLDSNGPALSLARRHAASTGKTLRRLPRSGIADRDLGTKRGDGYRIWAVERL